MPPPTSCAIRVRPANVVRDRVREAREVRAKRQVNVDVDRCLVGVCIDDAQRTRRVNRFPREDRLRGLLVKREDIDQRLRGGLQHPSAEDESHHEEKRAPCERERARRTVRARRAVKVTPVRRDDPEDHERERPVEPQSPTDVAPRRAKERQNREAKREKPRDSLRLRHARGRPRLRDGAGERFRPRRDPEDDDEKPGEVARAVVREERERERSVAEERERHRRTHAQEPACSLCQNGGGHDGSSWWRRASQRARPA